MAKTKEELVTMIETELVDPTSNKITGESVKAVLADIVDAMGTGGAMEYWAVPDGVTLDDIVELCPVFLLCKLSAYGQTLILGASYQLFLLLNSVIAEATAIAWDPNAKMYVNGEAMTALAALAAMTSSSITSLAELGFTQITEEEFYTV